MYQLYYRDKLQVFREHIVLESVDSPMPGCVGKRYLLETAIA